jgi:predicted DNA-binding transcriptional regulator AlpA
MDKGQAGAPGRMVLSIADFCAAYAISRAMLYKMFADGRGPRVMRVGSRRLISVEAAEEWRRKMETAPEAAA